MRIKICKPANDDAHECRDGRTVMSHALEGAQAPSWRFEATDLPWRFRSLVERGRDRISTCAS